MMSDFWVIQSVFQTTLSVYFTVFLNLNFLSYCLKHIKDCEFLIQRDDLGKDIPINLGKGKIMVPTVCTGFMFIRRTPNTLRLFKKSNIDQNVKCDQTYINNVLHQFKYKKLPLTVFPNGLYYKLFRKKITKGLSIGKEVRLNFFS